MRLDGHEIFLSSGDGIFYNSLDGLIGFGTIHSQSLHLPHSGKKFEIKCIKSRDDFKEISKLIADTHNMNIREIKTASHIYGYRFLSDKDFHKSDMQLSQELPRTQFPNKPSKFIDFVNT